MSRKRRGFGCFQLAVISLIMFCHCAIHSEQSTQKKDQSDAEIRVFTLNPDSSFQIIRNFGASDAWSTQFVGANWSEEAKHAMTQLLFSQEMDEQGNPLGIGLSAWRFNIGGGSAEQGAQSQITDEWRRAECFLDENGQYDWSKQKGQQWFLQAADDYGIEDIVAFVNSPPVFYTKNGKAWSSDGKSTNLKEVHYEDFAQFLIDVVTYLESELHVPINYVSPFNEPQWEWKCCGQEGTPWNNEELFAAAKELLKQFENAELSTKIELLEAGQLPFLYDQDVSPQTRNYQIATFFDPESPWNLTGNEQLAAKVGGHSYYSTWDMEKMINTRLALNQKMNEVNPDLEYWTSEYCILENNMEIEGNGRDLGMDAALYMARVMHADLTLAHANAWHWWMAISPYDYKDGLIYIDKNKNGGEYYESKMLWTMGNFSRFIRPGSQRISIVDASGDDIYENIDKLIASAYMTPEEELVVVFINQEEEAHHVSLVGVPAEYTFVESYLTSDAPDADLKYQGKASLSATIELPARSVLTCVLGK